MKYPYIGKWEYINTTVIFTGKNAGIEMGGGISFRDDWTEINYKNITAEYLANTYGEVKSKEHAEFIKLLAETNDIPCAVLSIDMNYTMFYVIDGCLFFCLKEIDVFGDYKKITIPLPPECESVDEWPKVGDDAIVINKNNHTLIYGHEVVGENVKVLTTYSTNDISMAVVEFDGCGYCFRVDMLQKPKTPEQELRDFISLLWDENNHDFDMLLDIVTEHVIKKPQ